MENFDGAPLATAFPIQVRSVFKSRDAKLYRSDVKDFFFWLYRHVNSQGSVLWADRNQVGGVVVSLVRKKRRSCLLLSSTSTRLAVFIPVAWCTSENKPPNPPTYSKGFCGEIYFFLPAGLDFLVRILAPWWIGLGRKSGVSQSFSDTAHYIYLAVSSN